jgi:hypothetical protein
MSRTRLLALAMVMAAMVAGLFGFGGQPSNDARALDADGGHGAPEPPMLGVHWARGQAGNPPGGASSSPNLVYHSGGILMSTVVQPIYWGTGWGNASFVGDKITGLGAFYGGVGGSGYMNTNAEYTDSSGAHFGTAVTLGSGFIDASAAPRRAPNTSAVLAEVAKRIANPVANGYYPVYVDTPRGHAGYCAWHSWGSVNGVPVQFAFFFNLDGEPGCDPADSSATHSQGLEALANVSGHELSEAVTDPRGAGWFDSSGAENADKCAWTFNQPVKFNGSTWKIQGNWSNAAYLAGSGYTRGCIDGN